LLLLATSALAGSRDHEDGLLLRLSGGVGYGQSKFDDAKISGPSGDVNFALGGIVSRNTAVHGTVLGWVISDPDVKVNGTTVGTINGDFELTGLGVGITHYFMPSNIYLSPTIGAGRLSIEDDHTDIGLVTDLTLGKEWWVGSHWGLGLAGAVGFHSISDGEVDGSWSAPTLALRFTATMN
jgi:hypothetical protein